MPELNNKKISYGNLSTFAGEMAKRYAKKGELPTKVSGLTNDAGYQTGSQVEEKINAKVASVYKPGGSVAFADLPELTVANLGRVVNVTDKFTTTDDFVEGAGKKHPAGTNVAIVQVGEDYKYDAMSGFVDLSGFVEAEQVTADIETAKTEAVDAANAATDGKLAGYVKTEDIETATEEEILALFADEGGGE